MNRNSGNCPLSTVVPLLLSKKLNINLLLSLMVGRVVCQCSCLSSTKDMVLVNKTWRLKVIEVLDYWCRISSAGQKHAAFRWLRSGSSTNLHIAYRNVCVTRQSLELNPRSHWLLLWVPSPSFEWLTYVEMTEGEGDFAITGYNKHLL